MQASPVRPLDPAVFGFFGFGDLLEPLGKSVRGVGVWEGAPGTTIVENGVFVPAATSWGPRPRLQGGILDADGRVVAAAQGRRRELDPNFTIEPDHIIDGEAIYLGWLFGHYGHFLLESLARAWFLQECDPSLPVLFHEAERVPPSSVVLQILAALGVPANRMLALDRPTRFRRITIPDALYRLHSAANPCFAKPFQAVARRVLGNTPPDASSQPLYLSRRLFAGDRAIVDEGELEDVLRENGFLVTHPETMTFADQVRLVNQHVDIFACDGSAVHNVLFALNRPNLHIFTGGTFFASYLADYFLVSTVAGAKANFVHALNSGGRDLPDRRYPLQIDMATVVAYLEAGGFLEHRLRASLAGRDPGRQERYDEAWLYQRVRLAVPDGEVLADEDLTEAVRLAAFSWPLAWELARYFATRDPARIDRFVADFARLAAAELDSGRLARYHAGIQKTARSVAKTCHPEMRERLGRVLAERFRIEVS